jgi:endoglucanase
MKPLKILCVALSAAVLFAFTACKNGSDDDDTSSFVAVTSISGVSTSVLVNKPLTLTGTVNPANATNKTIIWSVTNPGTTNAVINENTLTATATGTVSVLATIKNGKTSNTDYTVSISIRIVPFVPVTSITGIPLTSYPGRNLSLTGTVNPSDATNKTISWSVENAGTTNASITGNSLTTTALGTVTVKATITNGLSETSDYTQTSDITIIEPPQSMQFVSDMKIGWNLGNTFDGHSNLMPSEGAWQSNRQVTRALIQAVADQGFGAVRIPVTWGQKLHTQLRYPVDSSDFTLTVPQIEALTLDAAWLNRIEEVAGWVNDAGMKAIINIHHDGADSSHWLSVKTAHLSGANKDKIDAIYRTLWTRIANKFKDTGDYLLFEAFNELHDGSWGNGNAAQHSRVNELNQIFVNTVRATGGENTNRFLVIPGWVTRPSVTVSALVLPADTVQDRLIVTIHYYDPYAFTGDASWSTWGSKANTTSSNNWANEPFVRNTFDSVRNKFINNGVPVIIGEYGAVRQSGAEGKAHRKYYMEYVTKYAHDCGFIPFYWDNGSEKAGGSEAFGLFSRVSPHVLLADAQDIITVMMKAVNDNYSLSSITPP